MLFVCVSVCLIAANRVHDKPAHFHGAPTNVNRPHIPQVMLAIYICRSRHMKEGITDLVLGAQHLLPTSARAMHSEAPFVGAFGVEVKRVQTRTMTIYTEAKINRSMFRNCSRMHRPKANNT
jgi:hypothetical protein